MTAVEDAFGHPQSAVVLGGTSEIAAAILDRLVADRCRRVALAGRDRDALGTQAARLLAGGAQAVETLCFTATDVGGAGSVVDKTLDAVGGQVDLVLVAVGALGDQATDEADPARVAERIAANFTWPAAAMAAAAGHLRAAGHGRIVVFSSVAGVRVRRSNFLYGSAKAGLDGFSQGLAESLAGSGVHVHIVRPGFVRTKMTRSLPPAPFAVDPSTVASVVLRGMARDQRVIWVPPVLGPVVTAARHLPRSAWRRIR
ncbi:MAG TPA: SDR family NAD(P)-dependent oxidoreductase [Acidimicrobiales bacterium]|nr:SDR family NAD(P)-dependent oxidoreductase [Acidimicrobiales bacterium]